LVPKAELRVSLAGIAGNNADVRIDLYTAGAPHRFRDVRGVVFGFRPGFTFADKGQIRSDSLQV